MLNTVINIFGLIAGLVLLVQSAKVFVDACIDIATRLKISTVIIGLTIGAMGTSAPEVAISISAAIGGAGDLAIANSVGSNMFNLVFIFGLCAVIAPIAVKTAALSRDFWVSVGAAGLLLVMAYLFGDGIPRLASAGLLVLFVMYLFFVVRTEIKNKADHAAQDVQDEPPRADKPLWRSIVFAVLGIVLIVAGGRLTVASAVNIADIVGISTRVVGLTIIAVGTSLPELVTTLVACRKKEGEFAVALILGSSIFNILFVLGLAGTITTLDVDGAAIFDILALIAGSLVFLVFVKTGSKISRAEGFALVLIYVAYMGWAVFG